MSYVVRCNVSDKDIYIHPANLDVGISGDTNNGLRTQNEEHMFDDIPACSMDYQVRIQSGYHHEILDTDNDEHLNTSPLPTEERM